MTPHFQNITEAKLVIPIDIKFDVVPCDYKQNTGLDNGLVSNIQGEFVI